jgi:hypothetical protein
MKTETKLKNDKFVLTSETKQTISGKTLYRIKALKSFYIVAAGELGGFIEKEANLAVRVRAGEWLWKGKGGDAV